MKMLKKKRIKQNQCICKPYQLSFSVIIKTFIIIENRRTSKGVKTVPKSVQGYYKIK